MPSPFLQKKVREVEGPISVYQMSSNKYPQIFYLFGDHHVKKSMCAKIPKFHTWIKDTILNSPVFIDFYLETPYQYMDYPTSQHEDFKDSYMQDFYKDFKKCFIHVKNLPGYCQTSRLHYTDTRRITETPEQEEMTDAKYEDIYSHFKMRVIKRKVKKANDFFDFVTNPHSFLRKRIKKQFDAIGNKQIRDTINKELVKCLDKYKKGIRHLVYKEPDRFKVLEVLWAVDDYEKCLMDFYLIARCFRSYDKKEGYSRPGYNNIIYAGDIHVKNYVKILKMLEFHVDTEMQSSEGKKYQCLDISKIRQPLFHQRYM